MAEKKISSKLENIVAKNTKIPKVLHERLLINEDHRKLLRAMETLSPKDTGYILLPDSRSRDVPTVKDLAIETEFDETTVRKYISEITDIWHIPQKLPSQNGNISPEQASISALTNQHKLRWDDEANDYRVPRIHMMSAELGTGTLYTRNKAFEGERIFRQATGLDDLLNSYIIQGGVMPEVMSMFGKLKTQRAAMTGIDKTKTTIDSEYLDQIKHTLELAQMDPETKETKPLSEKQIMNLKDFVINTINTMPQAAKSVAYEIAPLVQNIPQTTPVHMFYSYNDDFNLDEIGDLLISSMRIVANKAREASEKLPGYKDELNLTHDKLAQRITNIGVANYIQNLYDERDEIPTGKKFRTELSDYFSDKNNAEIKKLKGELYRQYKRETGTSDKTGFLRQFDNAEERFFKNNNAISSLDDIESRKNVDIKRKEGFEETIPKLKGKISELENYEKAYQAQESEGHAWFTKKIAMNPEQSKAMMMVQKENYREMYDKFMFSELEKILGYRPNIKLHTDREMSIYIPDPAIQLGMSSLPKNKLHGTILSSYPRVNRQSSNEPNMNSFAILQAKHTTAIAGRVAHMKTRPETVEEFDKHHSLAFSDIVITSWGAEGFRYQPRIVVAPDRTGGEYRGKLETTNFVKLPTRHDTSVISDLAKKGNRGTWVAKRIEKGGPTTGNMLYIEHPDRSVEPVFIGDSFYEYVNETYGDEVRSLESKLARTRTKKTKEKIKGQLQTVYDKITEESDLYRMLTKNDVHLGATNDKNGPNNIDIERSTSLVAEQTYGLDGFRIMTGTEFLHGKQAFRSYDSSMEGERPNPYESSRNREFLRSGLLKKFKLEGASELEAERKAADFLEAFVNESEYNAGAHRPKDQIRMFKQVVQPGLEELLENKVPVYLGSGNHWSSSKTNIDESELLTQLFPMKYEYQGLLKAVPANGNSFTMHPIKLPNSGKMNLNAVLAHKMWSGNTEISALAKQAMGHKEDATIYLTADRHHTGMAVEREKAFFLDAGKQSTMDFVMMIGKICSARGTVVVGYNPHGHQMYSGRYFLDDVADKVIGWDERADKLRTNYKILGDELKIYIEPPVEIEQ